MKKIFVLAFLALIVLIFFFKTNHQEAFNAVFHQSPDLKTENDRVNILLLGIAGGNHDGPNLTDTIMLASYNYKTQTADLISVPRDLWVDKDNMKVNALYQIGLDKQAKLTDKNYALDYVEGEIGQLLGISIPYTIRVDFSGFVKAVDLVGGLDVDVERSFEDDAYPIPGHEDDLCGKQEKDMNISDDQAKTFGVQPGSHRVLIDDKNNIATVSAEVNGQLDYNADQVLQFFPCRFERLIFTKGMTHMDGTTALKYARSRHALGSEGSDFSRSKRQQQILHAFKDKVLSLGILSDPQKVVGLISTFGSSVSTNIPSDKFIAFVSAAKNLKQTKSYVIDDTGPNPLLTVPPAWKYGAFVLIPPNNDFSTIKKYVQDIFTNSPEATKSATLN